MVAGDYVTPPCPPERFLRQLFEMSYLAASTPEEGRYPEFNIVAVPADSHIDIKTLGQVWSFSTPRNATVEEFRRLAPSVDLKKSAILTRWDSKDLTIDGLIDLGTSWSRARLGLQYHYHFPPCLFIQVDRPGRLRTYQGQYLVAALRDGRLERHQGIEFPMSLHAPAHAGLEAIWGDLIHPKLEHVRDYESFAFTAIWNVLASLANCISEDGHGGAFIIVPSESEQNLAELRIKYRQSSPGLRDAFVAFMNARNRTIDYVVRLEGDKRVQRGKHAIAELALAER